MQAAYYDQTCGNLRRFPAIALQQMPRAGLGPLFRARQRVWHDRSKGIKGAGIAGPSFLLQFLLRCYLMNVFDWPIATFA